MNTSIRTTANARKGVFIIILIALLITGGIGYWIYTSIRGDVFTLSDHPFVGVESCTTVRVTGSPDITSVTIKVESRRFPAYEHEIEGDALYIKGKSCYDMVLQVPEHTDLHIIGASTTEISGVTGEIVLEDGRFLLNNVTLEGQSRLETTSYLIFRGDIADQAEVTIKGSSAPIDITLPHTASFQLNILGSPSAVTTTFPDLLLTVEDGSISEVHTQIGSSPNATLNIEAGGVPVILAGI